MANVRQAQKKKPKQAKRNGSRLLTVEALQRAAECLRILAHPHRLQMIQLLLGGQYTVGELAVACEIASAVASEHLRTMQRCGFLDSKKDGQRRYYYVVEPHLTNILACVEDRFSG